MLLNSMCGIVDEFYSEDNNLSVPDGYNKLEKSPFDPPTKLVSPMLNWKTQ